MAQANYVSTPIRSVTGLPGIPESQRPRLFVVEVEWKNGEGYLAEVDTSRCDLNTTIKDLIDGQPLGRPLRVFELRDVSQEIAQAIADFSYDRNVQLLDDTVRFLEDNGVHVPLIEAAE